MDNGEEPRNIETLCEEHNFSTKLAGQVYCRIGLTHKILCKYQSKEKDYNQLYPCGNPAYDLEKN